MVWILKPGSDALDAVPNANRILRPRKSYSSVFESSVTGATERSSMNDVIKKLTAEQALDVVKRLSEKGGEIGEALLAEAKNLLTAVDVDETADGVFCVLDSIDVQDCWDRSGSSRHGYTEPSEAAVELVEEELQPFYDQANDTESWVWPSKKRLTAWE